MEERFSFDRVYGETRTRNGMLRSLPPSLIAPKYLVSYTKKGSTCYKDKLNKYKPNKTLKQTPCVLFANKGLM